MANETSIVAAAFQNEGDARQALDALRQAGFDYDQIGVAQSGQSDINLKNDFEALGVPDDAASYYDQQQKDGRTIISVRPDGQDEQAHSILHRYNGYDYEHQSGYNQVDNETSNVGTPTNDTYTTTGSNTANTQVNTASTGATSTQDEYSQPRSLRLRGEKLNVSKDNVQTGEVTLGKNVVTEQQTINVPVTHEEIVIERHAVGDDQSTDNTPIGEGEVIRMPVSEERVNVSKDTYATGEVSIGKRQVQENQQVSDTVSHEEAQLNQQGNPVVQDAQNSNFGTTTTADATTTADTTQDDATSTDNNL